MGSASAVQTWSREGSAFRQWPLATSRYGQMARGSATTDGSRSGGDVIG
jgi:hypothetical protein